MESLEPEEAEDTNAEAVEAGEVALRDIFHCSLTITTTDRRVLFTLLSFNFKLVGAILSEKNHPTSSHKMNFYGGL